MRRDTKKPLLSSTVNFQVSTLFSNIIELKYENGLPCDLSFAKTQRPSKGLYHFRQNTQFPQNFGRFTRKSAETFRLRKVSSPKKLDKKASILRCERMETIIYFRNNMMAQLSFFY